jgi:tRNA threonylcarbamoyladenosine biosynthesis protein TsaE
MNFEIISNSRSETISIGKKLGAFMSGGDVLALVGELGCGKTTFTKGIAVALGAKSEREINSPSFVLIKEHEFKIPLYHMDVYRIKNPIEIELIGFDEYLSNKGVLAIEWADRIEKILPESYLKIEFTHLKRNGRLLRFMPIGRHYEAIMKKFKSLPLRGIVSC